MEFVVILVIVIILMLTLKYIFEYKLKGLEERTKSEEMDNIVKKYPSNIEVCKEILDKLNNKEVEVVEDKEAKTSLYIIATNKILIGDLKESYARIQVVAHECLHSIQDKKILWFNFIFSNIYNIFTFIIIALSFFNKLPMQNMFLSILLIFGAVQMVVKNYLETDVMIKARYVAKEYMEKKACVSSEEIKQVVNKYDEINNIGIKLTNVHSFFTVMVHAILFLISCLV